MGCIDFYIFQLHFHYRYFCSRIVHKEKLSLLDETNPNSKWVAKFYEYWIHEKNVNVYVPYLLSVLIFYLINEGFFFWKWKFYFYHSCHSFFLVRNKPAFRSGVGEKQTFQIGLFSYSNLLENWGHCKCYQLYPVR